MSEFKKLLFLLTMSFCVITFAPKAAEDSKKPSGTVSINETEFGLIISGTTGGGQLTYEGKKYLFKLSGIGLGANVGMSKVAATGEVYDLTDLSKFSGTYSMLEGSLTLGGGRGGTVLRNENGVIMRLKTTSEGLQLNLSASGVKVKLEK